MAGFRKIEISPVQYILIYLDIFVVLWGMSPPVAHTGPLINYMRKGIKISRIGEITFTRAPSILHRSHRMMDWTKGIPFRSLFVMCTN